MKYGQTVMVNRPDHPLFSHEGFVYRIMGNSVTVLFDKEVLFDFLIDDLVDCTQKVNRTGFTLMERLG